MPIKKRDTSQGGLDTPWNTARCHRLIRPLVSSIQALKQAWQRSNPSESTSTETQRLDARQKLKRSRYGKTSDENDHEWGLHVPRKRLKRTYSGRNGSMNAQSTRCNIEEASELGKITIATPLLSRTAYQPEEHATHNNFVHVRPDTSGCEATPYRTDGQPVVKLSHPLLGKVLEAFDRVLVGTNTLENQPDSQPPPKGALSLFSLCLKSVPSVIAEEQRLLQELDPDDDTDVSAEIYAALEDMETLPGRGWKHLAEVVRAHAVSLVQRAICDMRLDWEHVLLFVNYCRKYRAFTETHDILSAFCMRRLPITLGQQTTKPVRDTSQSPAADAPIQLPHKYRTIGRTMWSCQHLNCTCSVPDPPFYRRCTSSMAFQIGMVRRLHANTKNIPGATFYHFSQLLTSGKFSIEWLVRWQAGDFWNQIFRSISRADDNAAVAALFVEHFLTRVCALSIPEREDWCDDPMFPEAQRNVLRNTLLSLMGILVSMAVGSADADLAESLAISTERFRPVRSVTTRLAYIVAFEHDHNIHVDTSYTRFRMIILATEIVASLYGRFANHISPELLEVRLLQLSELNDTLTCGNDSKGSAIQDLSKLIYSISGDIARAQKMTILDALRQLVSSILSLGANDAGGTSAAACARSRRVAILMRQVALGAAMEFAEQFPQAAHAAFAKEIEALVGRLSLQDNSRTPAKALPNRPVRSSVLKKRFRWEEGLCEWVAATPAQATPGASVQVQATPSHGALPVGEALTSPFKAPNSPAFLTPALPSRPTIMQTSTCDAEEDKENIPDAAVTAQPLKARKFRSLTGSLGAVTTSEKPTLGLRRVLDADSDEDELSMEESRPDAPSARDVSWPIMVPVVVVPVPSAAHKGHKSLRNRTRLEPRLTRSAVSRGSAYS